MHLGNVTAKFRSFSKKIATTTFVLVFYSGEVIAAMAADIPPWAVKAIDKIGRGFLWGDKKDVKGGHCLVAWPKVRLPKDLGGLCISNIQNLCWALRIRCLWLQKSDPGQPRGVFQLQIHKYVQAFFSMAVVSEVGNGALTLFWSDKWIHGG